MEDTIAKQPGSFLSNLQEEKISLADLSVRAKELIKLVTSTPDYLTQFAKSADKEAFWVWAEKLVGPISASERQTLEMLADLFFPDSSLSVVVENGGCSSSCEWKG